MKIFKRKVLKKEILSNYINIKYFSILYLIKEEDNNCGTKWCDLKYFCLF